MSAATVFIDRIKGQLQEVLAKARGQLLGSNNERLDYFMDSFYKLESGQRAVVIAGGGVGVAVLVGLCFALYVQQSKSLTNELNTSFKAMYELRSLYSIYSTEEQRHQKMMETIKRRTSSIRMKPFFEKIAINLGVTIDSLNEKVGNFPEENPLSQDLQPIEVEIRLSKISIPRLMNFMVEVEKSSGYLRIQDLEIRGRYGTKLYFDSQLKVRGYKVLN